MCTFHAIVLFCILSEKINWSSDGIYNINISNTKHLRWLYTKPRFREDVYLMAVFNNHIIPVIANMAWQQSHWIGSTTDKLLVSNSANTH